MISYDKRELGVCLKQMRIQADLTQSEVATNLGYKSSQFISNMECGKSVVPLNTLVQLLKLYKSDGRAAEKIILEGSAKDLRRALASRKKA